MIPLKDVRCGEKDERRASDWPLQLGDKQHWAVIGHEKRAAARVAGAGTSFPELGSQSRGKAVRLPPLPPEWQPSLTWAYRALSLTQAGLSKKKKKKKS